jgi:polysaccharide pyruvyl transferase WcaK-like protein
VTSRGLTDKRDLPVVGSPRVGLFGLLGSGNIGNEAQMETVLAYLRTDHPDAVLDAMCSGPERLYTKYGIDAIPLLWYQKYEGQASGVKATVLKVLGKGVDAARTASWVRRHDVVIVAGAGVLEDTLPLRAWGLPYMMLLLCAFGRLSGTKVALVSVGANVINKRATRWLFNSAARLAFYRSYRDIQSRDAMQQRGVDTSGDHVYPDLAFGVPTPPYDPGDPQIVGVGVMAYYGGNDDRHHANHLHTSYIAKMKNFIRWLVDNGYMVRLVGGDNKWDDSVAQEILADVRAHRPDLDPAWVIAEPVMSFEELMRELTPVGTVVATRYHNVLCALKLCKPTISLGYSQKFIDLMANTGMEDLCQFADSLDVDLLIKQFTDLQSRSEQLRQTLRERNEAKAQLLRQQFATLSALLFPVDGAAPETARSKHIRGGVRRKTQRFNIINGDGRG